jgi:hypothetical protein
VTPLETILSLLALLLALVCIVGGLVVSYRLHQVRMRMLGMFAEREALERAARAARDWRGTRA